MSTMFTEKDMTEIKAGDITRLLVAILKRYRTGKISSLQAYREAYLCNSILKSLEVSDLQERLERIEEVLKK